MNIPRDHYPESRLTVVSVPSSQPTVSKSQAPLMHLKQWWKGLMHWFDSSAEPRVWQKHDRQGNPLYWCVYDPELGRSMSFGSEMEVRLWLEHRFYRR